MSENMSSAIHNRKILNRVVEFVSINMVDNLAAFEFPSKVKLHNVPMLKHAFPIDRYDLVTVIPDVALPFSVSSLFSEKWISVPLVSEVVGVAEALAQDFFGAAFNTAKGMGGMLDKFSGCFVSNRSFHALSSLQYSLPQTNMDCKRNGGANRVNSGEPLTGGAEGNPEPSREYTPGRCNDYRRGAVPLMTG